MKASIEKLQKEEQQQNKIWKLEKEQLLRVSIEGTSLDKKNLLKQRSDMDKQDDKGCLGNWRRVDTKSNKKSISGELDIDQFIEELVNYVEHYGLTRKYLGDGRYEHVQPRHSWNAAHKVSNWLLINLQRHSDHHYKPNRRFALFQNYTQVDAPQLPHSYPIMTMAAMAPPIWRKIMNPRVQRWRDMYYPEITDWRPYNKAALPMPR